MYKRTITIAIVSSSLYLENILAKADESDEFLLSFTTAGQLLQLDLSHVDMLIDDTCKEAPDKLQVYGDNRLPVIVCVTQSQLAQLSEAVKARLTGIWLKPFADKLIVFQFQKLVQQVILARQYRLSQIYLDTLINNVPDLIWFKSLTGIHVKVNNEFCYTAGKARQDIEGYDHYHIWDIDKAEYENSDYVCLDTDAIVIQTRKMGVFDEKVAGQRGLRQLKTYKAPIFDDSGELIGTVGAAQDVTELKNMDAELEVILNTMPFAIMIQDLNGQVLNVNQKFEEFFRTSRADIIGKTCDILEDGAGNPAKLPVNGQDTEFCVRHGDTELILKVHREPIYNVFANLIGSLYIYREITVERNVEEQLKKMAYTDELTGLFTRRYLYEYLDKNTNISQLHLLYMDLDNFKFVNDTYGHHYGDILLKHIGAVLQEVFPNGICVRIGGDEFLTAITGDVSTVEVEEQAQQLLAKIKTHVQTMPGTEMLSFSIGIAGCTGNQPVRLDELLEKSDQALYKAKKNGKNQYAVYHPFREQS